MSYSSFRTLCIADMMDGLDLARKKIREGYDSEAIELLMETIKILEKLKEHNKS